ncbi:MAG: dihydrolipoyl dehydrogenase [Rhodoferax sp.]|nr:dihydrolipoyl dehydrogenase [Rhodoferax sp.]MDP3654983.1 dihydrolipoyl dehydrogenase [Rhodoferax sp.]
MDQAFDVAIIGAGSAGLSALREVRKHTDNFVLINDGPYGTTCARVGCMPSKALIEVANAFDRRSVFKAFGIGGADGLSVDTAAVLRHVRALRDSFVAGVVQVTNALGERSLQGRAQFIGPQMLEVNGETISARRIVIATGSRPLVPEAWRAWGVRVMTSDDLFEQATLPRHMAVVGLGGIGLEMAQALSRLGLEVHGFDAAQHLAGVTDPVVSQALTDILSGQFAIHLGASAELQAHGERMQVSAGNTRVVVDKVLVALGRRPHVNHLGLDRLGVELDEHGVPQFNPQTMQIGDLPIYIAGDANAHRFLLHEAADEGHIAGHNAARAQPECFARRTPLGIVFTDPNVASVGRAYADLQAGEAVIGAVDFKGQGRSRMGAQDHGHLRIYAARQSGELLGAELCVPHGEHLAHLLALAVQSKLSVRDVLRMPFYHPVLEEGLRSALRDAAGRLQGSEAADLAFCDRLGTAGLE